MKELEESLDKFLFGVLPCLLDRPESLEIKKTIGDGTCVVVIECEEISKLVGKGGRTINSIKQIAGAIGAKHKTWVNVILNG